MILSDRRFLGLMGWGCALFLLLVAGWVGVCLVNRPPYLMPDTTSFDTGDIFFSVGDSWESVAVRALSGTSSWEVTDSTPSHCGIVVRDARGVRLAHASTAAGKIVVETPEEYLRNNGSYCIYAVKPPCLEQARVDLCAEAPSVQDSLELPEDFRVSRLHPVCSFAFLWAFTC